MKTITQFYLVRHGETEWNRIKRLQGHLDSPLTDKGKEQAMIVAKSLEVCGIQLIVCSPLGRALASAAICQRELNLKLRRDEGLIERNFGKWQKQYFDELISEDQFHEVFMQVTAKSPPHGESGFDCGARIRSTLKAIANRHPEEKILIVTHGDAIRCFLAQFSKNADVDAYSQFGNGRVFPIIYKHAAAEFNRFDLEAGVREV